MRRPTLALIGEHGPEAVVPLNQTRGNQSLPTGKISGDLHLHVHTGPFLPTTRQQIQQFARTLEPEIRKSWARRG